MNGVYDETDHLWVRLLPNERRFKCIKCNTEVFARWGCTIGPQDIGPCRPPRTDAEPMGKEAWDKLYG